VAQFAPGVPPPKTDEIKFHEPSGSPTPPPQPSSKPVQGQGVPPKHRQYKPRHQDINVDLSKEREHIKAQVKEEYMDVSTLDDTKLLMQYFRKHDSDKNHKLDGLELLKAIANMEADHKHDDDDSDEDHHEAGPDDHPGDGEMKIDIEQIIPIVDSILEQDDKNKDGYLNYAEFMTRQKQHLRSN